MENYFLLVIKMHCNKQITPPTTKNASTNAQEEKAFVQVCVHTRSERQNPERSLRNTFGWTRIDVLTMLIVYIFLASLIFSLLVEALQTLIHIDHQDSIHHPISVLILAGCGLLLNGLCYLLIGGYTFHQGSFLNITANGDVVLDRVVSGDSLRQGERRLSRTKRPTSNHVTPSKRMTCWQSFMELLRDICTTIFIIICCVIVYAANDENVTKYVDPLIAIISSITLMTLSFPYMKESCFILLQTIPGSIDIDQFKSDLMKTFKDIINVHDLHIWQLSAGKCVSTVHIIFQNPNVYAKTMKEVVTFFHKRGITIVTIQPEFKSNQINQTASGCLMECMTKECIQKSCCNLEEKELNSLPAILGSLPTTVETPVPSFIKSSTINCSNGNDSKSVVLSLDVTNLSTDHKQIVVPEAIDFQSPKCDSIENK